MQTIGSYITEKLITYLL